MGQSEVILKIGAEMGIAKNQERARTKLRIFVSSVQRELENERIAVSEIITTLLVQLWLF
jgi:hypothetical protein